MDKREPRDSVSDRRGAFLDYDVRRFVGNIGARGIEMAKKTTKLRP
jgi:hypothetical protein